ncbi:carbonic anhydrase 6-like [Glandiceps talaboti]
MDGMRYPVEMHLVSIDPKYNTLEEALPDPGATIVIATLIDIGGNDNAAFSTLFTGFDSVIYEGQSHHYQSPFPLLPMLPYDTWNFYRYYGSLTTPTCDESLTWTVMMGYQRISQQQFDNFQKLFETPIGGDDYPMGNNYRPVQDLNGRLVYRRINGNATTSSAPLSVYIFNSYVHLCGHLFIWLCISKMTHNPLF